ncbi:reverse transcriptase domain-containing protein, partial [Tanacetum coccineum]
MNFMIVRSLSPYNGIIERPGIREIRAVPSTSHRMLKFPEILKEAEVRHKNLKVVLHLNFPDQEIVIGGTLSEKGRTQLCSLLKENLDISAWQPSNMTGVLRSVAKHRLNIREGYTPVRQKKMGQAPERSKAIQAEVQKLVEARIIREVHYHDWLSNPVMVKKHEEGIKPCPDKTEAVLQLPSPRTIKELPLLVAPKPKEELSVYLSASYGAISAVLMTERGTVQMPVYFVSRALQGPELNYAPMEKLVLALVFTSKRRLQKWSVMLGEHNIMYRPRTSVKGQILADFLIEKPDKAPPDTSVFTASNNEAEYEALIAGLRIAAQIGVHNLHMSVDYKLVANQVLGTYIAKEENMVKYLKKDKNLINGFANFSISQVPRSNKKADALSKIASTSFAHLSKQVLVKVLKDKSIQEKEVATVVEEEGPTWMTPIVEYLRDVTLPDDKKEASKLLAMDYFTKWIEAKAVATITGNQVKKFVWDNIVCRFGLLGEIVSDNDKQFSDNPFKDWCEKLNIIQHFASVKQPQSNGLVERANRSLEAVIPVEIGMPKYRTAVVDAVHNNEELRLNLDLLEERRERAAIRKAKAKLKMLNNEASHAMGEGKLRPKWEGPYEVTEALGEIAYMLRSLEGTVLPQTRYYGQSKLYIGGRDLDLSSRGDASSLEASVCTAASA